MLHYNGYELLKGDLLYFARLSRQTNYVNKVR